MLLRFLALLLVSAHSLYAIGIADGVVRILSTSQHPDYRQPWTGGEVVRSSGSGFIVEGNRIITNAHVVSNAKFLSVTREGMPAVFPARVLFVAHDCDLAMITVDDERFFAGTTTLPLGGIPEMESTVAVYGFPIGGDRLSVTRGVVSRIGFQHYSHSGVDSHLVIQIDAAINPGNSGGPVMQYEEVVGVAFQGYSGDVAQNVGYMIPTPVVKRFLADVATGTYDRYVDLGLAYFPVENEAMRRALGVTDVDSGAFVGMVLKRGSSGGVLEAGDVMLAIDGYRIYSDGMVVFDNTRVPLSEITERKFKGDTVKIDILRRKEHKTVEVTLDNPEEFLMQARRYDIQPRYVIYGGLVFQPLSANFMIAHSPDNMRLRYIFDNFIAHGIYEDRPEIVVLGSILNDPVNADLSEFIHSAVDKVNGKTIRSLAEFSEALKKEGTYTVIETLGSARPIVLERAAVQAARERIMERYRITSEENLAK